MQQGVAKSNALKLLCVNRLHRGVAKQYSQGGLERHLAGEKS